MIAMSLLQPPLAFLVLLMAAGVLSVGLSRLAERRTKRPRGATASYACGEDLKDHLFQPDYAQFLPFAFFFTILHVIALMAATVPVETVVSFSIAAIYLGCASLGVYVLYSR